MTMNKYTKRTEMCRRESLRHKMLYAVLCTKNNRVLRERPSQLLLQLIKQVHGLDGGERLHRNTAQLLGHPEGAKIPET